MSAHVQRVSVGRGLLYTRVHPHRASQVSKEGHHCPVLHQVTHWDLLTVCEPGDRQVKSRPTASTCPEADSHLTGTSYGLTYCCGRCAVYEGQARKAGAHLCRDCSATSPGTYARTLTLEGRAAQTCREQTRQGTLVCCQAAARQKRGGRRTQGLRAILRHTLGRTRLLWTAGPVPARAGRLLSAMV